MRDCNREVPAGQIACKTHGGRDPKKPRSAEELKEAVSHFTYTCIECKKSEFDPTDGLVYLGLQMCSECYGKAPAGSRPRPAKKAPRGEMDRDCQRAAGVLIWAPLLAEDGIAQTFNLEYPDVCFGLPEKGLPYNVRWGPKDENADFLGVENYPRAVGLCIDREEYVDKHVKGLDFDCARSLAPMDVPEFEFQVSGNCAHFERDEKGDIDLVPHKIAEDITSDP
jgi:hypothetical protein